MSEARAGLDGGLAGRIVVVTGATAGIGEAVAREVVRLGARVVINARRAERLAALAAELNGRSGGGPRCWAVAGDCAEEGVIEEMLETARRGPGGGEREADAVVVNAGRGLAGSLMTSDASAWEEVVRTNVIGAGRLMRAAGERMVREASAAGAMWVNNARDIVVLGSVVGRHISPFSSLYGGTKFAVHSYAEAMRREVGPKGVRVSLIEPGIVRSEFQAVAGYDPVSFGALMEKFGPVLEPMDVARSIVFVLGQPAGVHVSDIVLRGTRQEYP